MAKIRQDSAPLGSFLAKGFSIPKKTKQSNYERQMLIFLQLYLVTYGKKKISIGKLTLLSSSYNGQKFREMRISHYVMRNIISRNFQCEFRVTENKAFLRVGYLK